jgi:hypothetical protein
MAISLQERNHRHGVVGIGALYTLQRMGH